MSMEFVSKCGLTMITILVIGTISNVTTYYPTSAKAKHLQVNIFKNVSCHFSAKNLINCFTQQCSSHVEFSFKILAETIYEEKGVFKNY